MSVRLATSMLPRVAAINGAILKGLSDEQVAALYVLLDVLQHQANRLLGASAWPKADRRRRRQGDRLGA